jgi:hypothetical protein
MVKRRHFTTKSEALKSALGVIYKTPEDDEELMSKSIELIDWGKYSIRDMTNTKYNNRFRPLEFHDLKESFLHLDYKIGLERTKNGYRAWIFKGDERIGRTPLDFYLTH